MTLVEYENKRHFDKTAEPSGRERPAKTGRPIFVVQLHHASHRHYDFRLQVGDVLKSWAVPKGPSLDPGVKRLAAEVEDHPVDYATFEGVIPKGQYGAGDVAIFDSGLWSTEHDVEAQLKKGHLRFELFGKKLRGSWHLIRTARSQKKPQWLLVKQKDQYAGKKEADDLLDETPENDATIKKTSTKKTVSKKAAKKTIKTVPATKWKTHALKLPGAKAARAMEQAPAPQLAKLASRAPAGDEWLHEIKWDGYRITAVINDSHVVLWSRNGLDWTKKLPDIVSAIEQLQLTDAVIDGELIARRGTREDFGKLQATLSGDRHDPLTYVMLDLLQIDGVTVSGSPLLERKKLLARILSHPVPHLALSSHGVGDGAHAFELAIGEGFEGIISKRKDAPYRSGRSEDWLKTKKIDSEEFAVVGYTAPKGSRQGLGALLLARRDGKSWRYAGKVGSGFSDDMLRQLSGLFENTGSKTPTVSIPENDTDLSTAKWFKPRHVAEVYSRGLGSNGLLRQPTLKTLRLDKKITDIKPMKNSDTAKLKTGNPAKAVSAKAKQASIALTHPDKVVFPEDGYTKQQVADYYQAVMKYFLPAVADRPLSLIRCPGGINGKCFFQKHELSGVDGIDTVTLTEQDGDKANYLVIRDASDVMELVQLNALEFHPWGAKADKPDLADLIVFDLDPGEDVDWSEVRNAARHIRKLLLSIGLESFVRTSGGKGLHVAVPLNPPCDWKIVKPFARSFAESMAQMQPDKFVATASKSLRHGRIFLDYLRNGKGATSVASYSLRARAGAPVAMPISWTELARVRDAAAFTIQNVPARLAKMKSDPWAGINKIKQNLKTIDFHIGKNLQKRSAK